jgi:hypothetical protein
LDVTREGVQAVARAVAPEYRVTIEFKQLTDAEWDRRHHGPCAIYAARPLSEMLND